MQTLSVASRLFPLVVSGDKTSTIRWREIEISPGYLRYVDAGDPRNRVVVWVTRCTSMPLSEAAAFVGRQAEWPKPVMLEGMREHYPAIGWQDTVQVIEHLTPAEARKRSDFMA